MALARRLTDSLLRTTAKGRREGAAQKESLDTPEKGHPTVGKDP